jgi:hypothetical protein
MVTFASREDGMRSLLVARSDDARSGADDIATVERLRESVTGHLRNAPNMVGVYMTGGTQKCEVYKLVKERYKVQLDTVLIKTGAQKGADFSNVSRDERKSDSNGRL